MIMKKIFFSTTQIMTGILIMTASLTSCKKLIEIPSNPPSSITQKEQFADSATTMTAVAGIYVYNAGIGFAYSDARLTYNTSLSADELSSALNSDNQQFYNYTLTPLNSGAEALWTTHYQSIYQVNAVLNGVTNSVSLSATFKKQIAGEMEVVRALYYFNLVNLYDGVPLVTQTDYNQTDRLPKATTAAIYTQIMTDLADAQKKLAVTYPSSGRARPNLYTAMGLLAKVNLYQGKWQYAYNEADSVIQSGNYSLEPNPKNVFLDGSSEAIWQIPSNQGYYGVADAQNFVPNYSGAIPGYLLTTSLLNAFETGDKRFQDWVASDASSGNTLYYPYKYKNVVASTTPVEDQMVLRLAELYLIRAEAAAHLNNLTQALADVNSIRTRAGLAPSTASTETGVLNAIMQERRIELFCEWGNRWYDLKRTGTAAQVLGAEKTGFNANSALYPIPQSQILLNNQLKQNPGY